VLSLEQALAALPDTPDGIAAHLAERGIRGRRFSAQRCPIAAYVRAETGGFNVTAGRTRISATSRLGVAQAGTPLPVRHFMRRFDQGYYPELAEVADA
jgi:hypothetical protein